MTRRMESRGGLLRRLLAVVAIAQACRQRPRIARVAADLGVSERTARRYLDLVEELGLTRWGTR